MRCKKADLHRLWKEPVMPVVRVIGLDHQPRSSNFSELPIPVAVAALSGLGQFLPEFRAHEFEWIEKPLTPHRYK